MGPWDVEELRLTPVSGGYTFENADMSTIKGIGGRLNSTGKFDGHLERIRVVGVVSVPDFQLQMTKQPVKLETQFRATVDGTSGDTYLEQVDGAGLVEDSRQRVGDRARKAKGRSILLDVQIGARAAGGCAAAGRQRRAAANARRADAAQRFRAAAR